MKGLCNINMSMETTTEAMSRLSNQGYKEQFRAEEKGLKAVGLDRFYDPKELIIDEIVRFEGEANPDQMAILFALRDASGEVKGTYYSSYGANVASEDGEVISHLETSR